MLGLKPEPYAVLRETLAVAWRMTDHELLDLCRLRLAQLMEVRAELAGGDDDLLSALASWESSAAFDERTRAALAFSEQYHYDHLRLRDGDGLELRARLGEGEAVNFVWALHMNDAYLRILRLLDIDPDPLGAPPRLERTPLQADVDSRRWSRVATAGENVASAVDPDFAAVKDELNRVTVRESLVDEVTSEAVRLHNAAHQQCVY